MKKNVKNIFTIILSIILIITVSTTVNASETTEDVYIDTISENSASDDAVVLLDSLTFAIKSDGTVIYDDEIEKIARLSDVVTGSISYYYLGKDSQSRPKYQVVMNIVSETNLKSSVLSTKAEGVSTWHNNKVSHSGKTGTNTRTYVYTSENPPSNPYCYVKATITISDGTTYSIASKKYTNPISK